MGWSWYTHATNTRQHSNRRPNLKGVTQIIYYVSSNSAGARSKTFDHHKFTNFLIHNQTLRTVGAEMTKTKDILIGHPKNHLSLFICSQFNRTSWTFRPGHPISVSLASFDSSLLMVRSTDAQRRYLYQRALDRGLEADAQQSRERHFNRERQGWF